MSGAQRISSRRIGTLAVCTLLIGSSRAAFGQDGLPYIIPQPEGSSAFGRNMESGGDATGDGRDEILIYDTYRENPESDFYRRVSCHDGADGSLLWLYEFSTDDPGRPVLDFAMLSNAGPGGRDAVATLKGTSSVGTDVAGELRLVDGETGTLIWSVVDEPGVFELGDRIGAIRDLTGDDIGELLVKAAPDYEGPTSIRVLNGADGSTVFEIESILAPWSFADAGDLDGDEVVDLLVGSFGEVNDVDYYGVTVISGADGTVLGALQDPDGEERFGYCVAGGHDVTGDNVPDFLVGRPEVIGGTVFLISGTNGRVVKRFSRSMGGSSQFGIWCGFADVAGDESPEVLVADAGYVYAYQGRGEDPTRVWSARPYGDNRVSGRERTVGDINGDGFDDVVGLWPSKFEIPGAIAYAGSFLSLSFDPESPRSPLFRHLPWRASLVIDGARPGATVHLLYSRFGNDCTFVQKLGICIDLTQSVRYVGAYQADATGCAAFDLTIPKGRPTGNFWLQAVELKHGQFGAVTSDVMLLQLVE